MNYSYTQWKKHLMDEDVHAMAILSFPAVTQCATTVQELVQNAEMQSAVMRRIKEEFPLQEALVSMMDLSVEAQAFGCPVSFHEGEIPAVTSGIIKNREDGEALRIPKMEEGRMSVYLAGVENITKESDRPVFGGVCGPYSLAGRLMDVSEIMMQCIMDPKLVHLVLQKVTTFLKQYIQAYKDVGASGVILAEPLAGWFRSFPAAISKKLRRSCRMIPLRSFIIIAARILCRAFRKYYHPIAGHGILEMLFLWKRYWNRYRPTV